MPVVMTPALAALRRALEDLGRAREVSVEGLRPESAVALAALADAGRDFLAVTPALRQTVARFARQRLPEVFTRGGSLRVEAFWAGVGPAIQAHVLLRFRQQGGDVPLAPLRPATIYAKAHSRDPRVRANATKVGLATGATYDDLARARFGVEVA